MFQVGSIEGVIFRPLRRYHDERGWLVELFREDELAAEYRPVMAYESQTLPGVARGPHEHSAQADFFCFFGPSNFKLYLWDNRPSSATYRHRQVEVVGQDNPQAVIIPPGVVHAYKNVGTEPGLVFNCPNQLYRGRGRQEPVDEIRHEADERTVFVLD